jgi:hypothetical protein
MSRNNIWVHVTIALALILVAAFAGGVRRLRRTKVTHREQVARPELRSDQQQTKTNDGVKAEVLVRFRPGTRRETIDRITAQFNDTVEDRLNQSTDWM